MRELNPPIEKRVGDLRLKAVTARTGRTGLQAQVEVWNGKLLYSDHVNLSQDKQRGKFAQCVAELSTDVDVDACREALLELSQEAASRLKETDVSGDSNQYEETPEGLIYKKPTSNGTVPTKLTNFIARIVTDTIEDDGANPRRVYEVKAQLDGKEFVFEIPAKNFSAMGWPLEHLGPRAIIESGFGLKDHARAAIQKLSTDIRERRVYTHTGWTQSQDQWVYLHAGGAIGAEGSRTDLEVRLDGLGQYCLPDPPLGENLKEAVRASLSLLELASETLTYAVLSAVYRAPLAEAMPITMGVFIEGPTGAQKSEVTAIGQAHFGREFNGKNLPAGWSSTANALEKKAFLAKDAVLAIDDFKPTGTTLDQQGKHRDADRIFRGLGNQQGRGRMNADGNLQAEYYPRGFVLASGEDVPRGESLRARGVILGLRKGEVDLERLTQIQKSAREGLLAQTMAAYLQWLASQIDSLKQSLPKRQEELREKARKEAKFPHDRTPENIASLAVGLELFLKFVETAGVLTPEARQEHWTKGWNALVQAGHAQQDEQTSEDEVEQYLSLLETAISCGQAYLADADTNEEPKDAEQWGWKQRPAGYTTEWQPQGTLIGWLEGDNVYIQPGAAFGTAQKLARGQGGSIALSERTLRKRLAERGLLVSHDPDRFTIHRKIAGRQRRTLHLHTDVLGGKTGPSGPGGPSEDEAALGPGKKGTPKTDSENAVVRRCLNSPAKVAPAERGQEHVG